MREEIIKSLEEQAEDKTDFADFEDPEDVLGHDVADGWISVEDRLPRDSQMVLGYTPCDGYIFVGFYREYRRKNGELEWAQWYIITAMRSTKKITKKVTHWKPLPAPPEVRA